MAIGASKRPQYLTTNKQLWFQYHSRASSRNAPGDAPSRESLNYTSMVAMSIVSKKSIVWSVSMLEKYDVNEALDLYSTTSSAF